MEVVCGDSWMEEKERGNGVNIFLFQKIKRSLFVGYPFSERAIVLNILSSCRLSSKRSVTPTL